MSRAAGARNAASPAPMNGRNPVGKKQRFQALQRPPAFGRLACAIAGPQWPPGNSAAVTTTERVPGGFRGMVASDLNFARWLFLFSLMSIVPVASGILCG